MSKGISYFLFPPLGITTAFLPATEPPIEHVTGETADHPGLEAVRARHAAFVAVGFKGAEEPTDVRPQ